MRVGGGIADMKTEIFSEDVRKAPATAQQEEKRLAETPAGARDIASEDEVRAQLLALDDDAMGRLELKAATYRRMLPQQDVDDLVNETLRRVLDGCRKWPKDVAFMAFLFQTMRSIASEWWKRNRREVPDSQIETGNDGEDDDSFLERQPAAGGGPDDSAAFAKFADAVEEVFANDDDVMAVIIGRVEGLSAAETREKFDMTATAFATAQKRLRRAVLAGRLDGWR
jgi:DNA-directed RNA polymerase specialized sigma24 family protein